MQVNRLLIFDFPTAKAELGLSIRCRIHFVTIAIASALLQRVNCETVFFQQPNGTRVNYCETKGPMMNWKR